MMRCFVFLCSALVIAQVVCAQDQAATGSYEDHKQQVGRLIEEYRDRFADDPDKLVRPGLIADRGARQVTVFGETTEVQPFDPIEFFLISEESGHAYEALLVSFARPSDIHEALAFIGLIPGHPASARDLRFWPKGDRVRVTLETRSDARGSSRIPLEQLILDQRTGNPLEETGLAFTGSLLVPTQAPDDPDAYAADVRGPNSIASLYNEPSTVLDLPRQAAQGEIYGKQVPNPERLPPSNTLVHVTFEPARSDGLSTMRSLLLRVSAEKFDDETPGTLTFSVTDTASGEVELSTSALNDVLAFFSELAAGGFDPFVTVDFDGDVVLQQVQRLAMILASIDTESGIRIEAPPAGQLYYKAFAPPPHFQEREKRIAQPWELTLERNETGLRGKLTQIEQLWRDDSARPDLRLHHYPVPSPSSLEALLEKHGPGLPVLLITADPRITHAELIQFLAPVLDTHGTVHIFIDEPNPESADD